MPTITATFPTGHLSDAITKAARVSPSKGDAFDKAAGIMFSISKKGCMIMATNLETAYMQQVPVLKFKGEKKRWRIPARILRDLIGNLPLDESSEVTFTDREDAFLRITCGDFSARVALLDAGSFPALEEIDTKGMVPAKEFAATVEQAAWACSKGPQTAVSGVRVDGESIIGCDGSMIAVLVDCAVAVAQPVTVPLLTLAATLKGASDVRIRTDEKRLYMQLDPESFAWTTLINQPYPDVKKVLGRTDFLGHVEFSRMAFIDTMSAVMAMAASDAAPTLDLNFEDDGLFQKMVLNIEAKGVGKMKNKIDLLGGKFTGDHSFSIAPNLLLACVNNAKGDVITLEYGSTVNPEKSSQLPIHLLDKQGYSCWIAPKLRKA